MNWLQRFLNNGQEPKPSTRVATPDWLKRTLSLPPWATVADEHSHKVSVLIKVDTKTAMLDWLSLLEAPEQLTQYWIECAYQCAKLDLQLAIEGGDFDPRQSAMPAEFHFDRADEFALAKYPEGPAKEVVVDGHKLTLRGQALATNGREARAHYKRIRGRLPF